MNSLPTEHQALLYLIVGLGALTGIGSLIIQIIGTFKRTPPAEAQFADAEKNANEHDTLHRRINHLTDPGRTPFVLKDVYAEAEKTRANDRREIRRDLRRLNRLTTALAVKLGADITVGEEGDDDE